MAEEVKMVIVMRNDLNMRKGKMVAQGAHAASRFLIEKLNDEDSKWSFQETVWLENGTKKICVRADSEEHLLELYYKARNARVPATLVTDSGLTEFDGPTNTCVAIGPDFASKIDPITGSLKLL